MDAPRPSRTKRRRQNKKQKLQQTRALQQEFAVPTVTEEDLLAFQISHFGDDTRPETWFVDEQTALSYGEEYKEDAEEEEDDLGYYEDGVKRTLTDEQIAMFRHSELQQLERTERLRREQIEDRRDERSAATFVEADDAGAQSPGPSISSLEDELVEAAISAKADEPSTTQPTSRGPSRSTDPPSSLALHRERQHGIPFEERKKRKWEGYIEGTDPVKGSMTHRRLARELDVLGEETVDLDY